MTTIPEFDKMNQDMLAREKQDNVADDVTNSNEQKISFLYKEIEELKELVYVLTRNDALHTQIISEQTQILIRLADLYKPEDTK